MKTIESLGRVLMPTLAGEHYFTVLGHHGYGDGLLAKTEQGFVFGARRLMIGNRHEEILFPPTKISIVSPTVALTEKLYVLHHDAIVQTHREWLSYKFREYLDIFGKTPRGWVDEGDLCPENLTGYVDLWLNGSTHYFVWQGEGHIRDLFSEGWDANLSDEGGEDSVAPLGDDALEFFVAYRGYRGGMGDRFAAFKLDEAPPIHQTPAFFFQKIADLACLEPIRAEIAEAQRLELLRREESNQRVDNAMSEYEREENEKVRVLFERHFEGDAVR